MDFVLIFLTNVIELDLFLYQACGPLIANLHAVLKNSGPKIHPVEDAT